MEPGWSSEDLQRCQVVEYVRQELLLVSFRMLQPLLATVVVYYTVIMDPLQLYIHATFPFESVDSIL